MTDLDRNVGFDPCRWVERLRDVNASSQFTAEQRALIERSLLDLLRDLADQKRAALTPHYQQDDSK